MKWTDEIKISYMLRMPWTIVPSTEDGERVLRVREIPSVIATGVADEELDRELFDALRASLRAYLHFGDPLPRPPGVKLFPWEDPEPTAVPTRLVFRGRLTQENETISTSVTEQARA
jgi:hypothetical protein